MEGLNIFSVDTISEARIEAIAIEARLEKITQMKVQRWENLKVLKLAKKKKRTRK